MWRYEFLKFGVENETYGFNMFSYSFEAKNRVFGKLAGDIRSG